MEAPNTIANAKVAINAIPKTRFVPAVRCPTEPVEGRNVKKREFKETILCILILKAQSVQPQSHISILMKESADSIRSGTS